MFFRPFPWACSAHTFSFFCPTWADPTPATQPMKCGPQVNETGCVHEERTIWAKACQYLTTLLVFKEPGPRRRETIYTRILKSSSLRMCRVPFLSYKNMQNNSQSQRMLSNSPGEEKKKSCPYNWGFNWMLFTRRCYLSPWHEELHFHTLRLY